MLNNMGRRIHKKSRSGCAECKRRHLKCDEIRPICAKCQSAERRCIYEPPKARTRTRRAAAQKPSTVTYTNSPLSESRLNPSVHSPAGTVASNVLNSDINLHHLELFHHFESETCKTVVRFEAHVDIYRSSMVGQGLQHAFLMHQILAISALHLSLLRPEQAEFYRTTAATLQSTALVGFYDILPRVNASNCLVVLLFSHIVALHVFCDIFISSDENFNDFMERLVGCIKLLRGVNVVIRTWGEVLDQSPMGSIIIAASDDNNPLPEVSREECKDLRDLLNSADLSESSISTCRDAVDRLQLFFDREPVMNEASDSTNRIFSWLVTASPEFTDLLEQRRPEALIILSYYSVLLHTRRKSWAIGDSGVRLLNYITKHLGKSWENWLRWPNSRLAS